MKKKVVIALGHSALGTTFPEQQVAVKASAKVLADLVEEGCQLIITHSNAPQVGMIHTAMNEFAHFHSDFTGAPMSVCSAMSQGYIGYDLQNALRSELVKRGIYKTVSTILTQVLVDPYDEAFYHPVKVIGRYMTKEEAEIQEGRRRSDERGRFAGPATVLEALDSCRSPGAELPPFWLHKNWSGVLEVQRAANGCESSDAKRCDLSSLTQGVRPACSL